MGEAHDRGVSGPVLDSEYGWLDRDTALRRRELRRLQWITEGRVARLDRDDVREISRQLQLDVELER